MPSSDASTVHIIGAGLSGLAAAARLAGGTRQIVVHEAASCAGGRCRSYYDHNTGMTIDNGTHLVLSGNEAVLSYATIIGAREQLRGPEEAVFSFLDLANDERWTLRFSAGRIPWWLFDKERRVPQTAALDYLPLARLAFAADDRRIDEVIDCHGPLYERLLRPLLLAALNVAPAEGSAKLAGAILRETVGLGGRACEPLLARGGLGSAFVDPALAYLRRRNVAVRFEDELIGFDLSDRQVEQLRFADRSEPLGDEDFVVLAVPPPIAGRLLPGISVPTSFRGIINAHFRIDPPPRLPPMLGIINGTAEWIFSLPGRIAVTISNADRLLDLNREEVARLIWSDVEAAAGFHSTPLPAWQLVRERRATFAATPEQNALRPPAQTEWDNLLLAGDWTATGLPATLEGAVRSGFRAAEMIERRLQAAA
jgi:squalene-associated FAD-dependent desaturase